MHWAAVVLCGALLAAIVVLEPLLDRLAAASHTALPAALSPVALLSYVAAAPALWLGLPLALLAWWLGWRIPAPRLGEGRGPVNGLALVGRGPRDAIEISVLERTATYASQAAVRAAEWQRRWVEQGILERGVDYVVRATVRVAEWQRRWVEQGVLESGVDYAVRATVGAAGWAWRWVELGGIETLPRRSAEAALAMARALQRRHTGRLRRNLLWVVASVLLAVLVVFLAW
jgi:hypothetical protein